MMLVPAGIKVHIAVGYTDHRKGLDGLAVPVEQMLQKDPFSGHMFVFRGRRADMIQDFVLGRQRTLPPHKTAGGGRFEWPISITPECGQHHKTCNGTAVASWGLPTLLALEVAVTWRATEALSRDTPGLRRVFRNVRIESSI